MKTIKSILILMMFATLVAPGVLGVLANTIGPEVTPAASTDAIKGTYNFSVNYNTTATNGGGTVQNVTVYVGTITACNTVIGNSTSVANASCTYATTGATDGTYTITFSLWLTNGTNEVNDTVTGVVIDNTAPTASLTLDFDNIATTKLFTSDCSRSTDNLDTALSFSQVLTKPDTTTVTATDSTGISTFSETNTDQKGEYTLVCTVTDNAATTASQTATLTVKDKSTPIAVAMGPSISGAKSNNFLMFGGVALLVVMLGIFAIVIITQTSKKGRR